jgi:hypothetical protein
VRMQEVKERGTLKSRKRKAKTRATKQVINEDNSSTTRRVIDEEVGECIIVKPCVS